MTKRTALLTAALVAGSATPAHAALSEHRARVAIDRSAGAGSTIGGCRRVAPDAIRCSVTEAIDDGEWSGWNFTYVAQAVERRARIVVTAPDLE
jgi:hypothetical protein